MHVNAVSGPNFHSFPIHAYKEFALYRSPFGRASYIMPDLSVIKSCFLSCLLVLLQTWSSQQDEQSQLLLVSFDGFRWDYVNRVPTPNFRALIDEGVQVEQVENTYITKTYPNHYTLVTGLHAETHGIVANEMYDPIHNRSFSMEGPEVYNAWWWEEAVPLWVTNQKAGRKSGAAMWPGSDVAIGGTYPTHFLSYNASMPFEARVEKLIDWFLGPEAINFGVLYWEEPDESGHNLGPESPLMDVVIADIDDKLGFLRGKLKNAGLYDKVNLIVTSDHGMTQLSHDKIIELDTYVSRDLYTWIDKSPVVGILPKEGKNIKHLLLLITLVMQLGVSSTSFFFFLLNKDHMLYWKDLSCLHLVLLAHFKGLLLYSFSRL